VRGDGVEVVVGVLELDEPRKEVTRDNMRERGCVLVLVQHPLSVQRARCLLGDGGGGSSGSDGERGTWSVVAHRGRRESGGGACFDLAVMHNVLLSVSRMSHDLCIGQMLQHVTSSCTEPYIDTSSQETRHVCFTHETRAQSPRVPSSGAPVVPVSPRCAPWRPRRQLLSSTVT
jgi:hypothetical protein